MNTFNNWFQTFLDEKSVPYASWKIQDETGTTNFIDNDVVIEHIKIAPDHEQTKIRDILVKIDFQNGDVNHFLHYLAKGLVSQYGVCVQ